MNSGIIVPKSHQNPLKVRAASVVGTWSLRDLASGMCNALESLIDLFESRSQLRSYQMQDDPLRHGNFVPVASECPPVACVVEAVAEGSLPEFLEGVYLRNGPNQRYGHDRGAHHFFDGDGMLHAVSIRHGKATYSCRFTRTSRFVQEEAAGRALFPKVFATSGSGVIGIARIGLALLRHTLGVTDLSQGIGLANSGLIFHHSTLLALSEDDLPHAVDINPNGDLLSRGRYTFNRSVKPQRNDAAAEVPWAMTSHPKIDPATGEMFAFGYNPLFAPHLTYFWVSKEGVKSKDVAINLREPSMMHDFGLTSRYVIFPDVQVVFRPLRLLQGKSPIVCDRSKTPRFGVLPRYAQDDSAMRWFKVPGCNCFHFLNCWDEGDDQLVLIVPVVSRVDHVLGGDLQNFQVTLTEVRLNLSTGTSTQTPICAGMNLEMGSLNRNLLGVRNRFLYMGVAGQFPNLSGVVKVDLAERKVVASRLSFGEGWFASEPFFVPKRDSCSSTDRNSHAEEEAEDDGCLVCLVHDETSCTSRLLVLDPRSPSLDVVASVRIPRRVPYGFHGLFVQQQLIG